MSLIFPSKILDQHLVVLGKTGAGKSSALRHIVEHLLAHGKRVCIIDPKGDWWGLKSSANGKGAGFPIIAFGDFKEAKASDVPINETSGKHVSELITSGNRPCIIGFRGWMTSYMVRFWIDFAAGIFNANSGELYLIGDEFHNFAPKGKIMDPESGKCLHWSNRLMAEGRGLGIVCLIASQRPQKVHNDTLTSCETLVAMRVIHKSDRDAVQDWIEGCGDMDQGKEVLNSLAGMARGEAFVWSPEIGFGPKRLSFPMFMTFDSFAPPQLQKKVASEGWASVDLEAVKSKLAVVIEEQKANDPRELKKTILELRRQLSKPTTVEKSFLPSEIREIPILSKGNEDTINRLTGRLETACSELQEQRGFFERRLDDLEKDTDLVIGILRGLKTPQTHTVKSQPLVQSKVLIRINKPATHAQSNGEVHLGKCERSILTALAQYPQGRNTNQIAILSGYSVNSGGFNNSLSKLRSVEYISRGQPVTITQQGQSALGEWEPLPTGQELARHWIGRLGKCERGILSFLIENYPNGQTVESVAQATGYSANSGGFNNALSKLRTLELITRGQPMKASDEFFQ
jgi:hypothetical protein